MKRYDEATKKRERGRRYGALLLVVALLLAVRGACAHAPTEAGAVAAGKTWTVTDPSDTPASPGENTLRGIVGRAADGDVVVFAPGITEISLREELVIDKVLTIAGSATQQVTIRRRRRHSQQRHAHDQSLHHRGQLDRRFLGRGRGQ